MTKNDKILELVLEYQRTKSIITLNKIIELNQNIMEWFFQNTNLNISKEELSNLMIKALEYSVSMYDKDKTSNIIAYIALSIKRAIHNQRIYIEIDRNRLFASFLEYKDVIERRYGVTLEKDFSILEDILDLMIEEGVIRRESKEDIKKVLIELLKDYYGSLKIMKAPDKNKTLISNIELPMDSSYIKRILEGALTEKEYNYLVSYFGLFGNNTYTLGELASKEHVSKENIGQIKNKALERLKCIFEYYAKAKFNLDINKFRLLLLKLLTEEEYLYLTSFYGLFGNSKNSYQQLGRTYHLNAENISLLVEQALSKIFFYIEYQDLKFPYTEIELEHILKTNLSRYEYKTFTSIYGLFGKRIETKEEYAKINNLSNSQVNETLHRVNSKIKNIARNDKRILDFLKTMLTEEEFKCLSLKYGLLNRRVLSSKEVGEIVNQTPQVVNKIINLALEKIKVKLRYINIDIDKNLVQEVLQTLLSKEEYEYICKTYGIFGYQKLNKDSIMENENKLIRTNIKSFTKVATLINIESKGR